MTYKILYRTLKIEQDETLLFKHGLHSSAPEWYAFPAILTPVNAKYKYIVYCIYSKFKSLKTDSFSYKPFKQFIISRFECKMTRVL